MNKIISSDRTFAILFAFACIVAMWAWLTGQSVIHMLAPLAVPFVFGVADTNLILRDSSDGNLTADETTSAIDIGAGPFNGLPVRVHIPTDGGAGDKLDILFKTSDTEGGTYLEDDRISWERLSQADGTKTLAGVYRERVHLRRRWLKVTFDVTDGGGGVNFGAVDCRFESAGEYTNADRDL